MSIQLAREEYSKALSRGKKELRELTAAGKSTHPAVLDEILGDDGSEAIQEIGLVEIPADRIIGTKSAGRITAFTPKFTPILDAESEFGSKWIHLCKAHLDEGIRDPIICFEYLGNFYVQEGNKRVSVLRHFESPRIPCIVKRVVPPASNEPRIKAYYEFMEFFKASRLYSIQFRKPGDYAKLLLRLGKRPGERWTEQEQRTFRSYFQYFLDALKAVDTAAADVLPEEALLLWLQVHSYSDLASFTAAELKKSVTALWPDVISSTKEAAVKTDAASVSDNTSGIITRLIMPMPDRVHVAFVHQLDPRTSAWVLGHEESCQSVQRIFGERLAIRSYYNANTPEQMDARLEQAVAEGAQIVFTTSPPLSQSTLKAAVKYPKVQFYNCSVDLPYSSIRTYYGRMFEAKFITGAIAGAIAQDDRVGFIGSSPIMGMTASINAFALGAQMTNPRAQVELRWSCCEGNPQADFFRDGIRVVSNREVPSQNRMYLDFCNYGTYLLDDRGGLIPLASPVWVWGNFYELAIRSYLSGGRSDDRSQSVASSYWLGMDSGVIDVEFSDHLPSGVRALAEILRNGLRSKTIDPFKRRLISQDGIIKNDGSRTLSPKELLYMDWLCENVVGEIPSFQDILSISQPLVRELGIYRDSIPSIKER